MCIRGPLLYFELSWVLGVGLSPESYVLSVCEALRALQCTVLVVHCEESRLQEWRHNCHGGVKLVVGGGDSELWGSGERDDPGMKLFLCGRSLLTLFLPSLLIMVILSILHHIF